MRPVQMAAVMALMAAGLQAGTVRWDGGIDTGTSGSGTSWNTGNNWVGDSVPLAGDDLLFNAARSSSTGLNNNVAATLSVSRTISFHSITFDGSLGKLPDLTINPNASGFSTAQTLTLAGAADGSTVLLAMTGYASTAKVTFNPSTNGTLAIALGTSGIINVGESASTLTLNPAISGVGFGLTKTGAGTLSLAGINSYSGPTAVNGGTLNLAAGGTLANSALSVGTGGKFFVASGHTASSVTGTTLNGGSAFIESAASTAFFLNAIVRNAGATVDVITQAAGNLTTSTVNGAGNILGGYATATGGRGWAVSAATAGATGALSLLASGSYETTYANATAASDFSVTASGTLAGTGVNTLRFGVASPTVVNVTGNFVVGSGGILVSPAVSTNTSVLTGGTSITSGNGADLIVHQFNESEAFTVNTPVANNGATAIGLTKTGGGTLVLGATNTYTGGTQINAGTLQVGTGGTAGTLGSGNIVNNGVLTFNRSGNVTVSANISGTGPVNQIGPGVLTLSGSNSFTGLLSVTGGGTVSATSFVSLVPAPASAQAAVALDNGTLQITGTSSNTNANRQISVTSAGGTVEVASGRTFTTSARLINSGLSGALTKTGSGKFVLTNDNNTYAGPTSIRNGTLQVGASTSTIAKLVNTSAVTLGDTGANGYTGTLAGYGTVNTAATVTVNSGGTITAGTGAAASETPGMLTTGNQAWNSGGQYVWKTTASTGTAGTTWDLLNMATLTPASGFTIKAILGTGGSFAAPVTGVTTYKLADTTNTAGIANIASLLTLDTTGLAVAANAGKFTLSFDPGPGGQYDLNLNFEAAPEPTTAALFGLGASTVLGRRRRRVDGGASLLGLLQTTR